MTSGNTEIPVRTRSSAEGTSLEIEIGSGDSARTLAATILSCSEDTCVVEIEGLSTVVRLARHERGYHAMAGGEAFAVTSAAEKSAGSREADGSEARATAGDMNLDALCTPMPATVSAILVEPATAVEAGETLLRLEAMKMELAIRAPFAGRVKTVDCHVGALVQPGRPLITLEAPLSKASRARG